jgi:hypothetical protein
MSFFKNLFQRKASVSVEQDSESDEEKEVEVEIVHEKEEEPTDVFHFVNLPNEFLEWDSAIRVYHFLQSSRLIPHLDSWSYNRPLQVKQVDKIKDILRGQKHPHLMGSIQCLQDKDHRTKIINGQHRWKAVEELMKEDPEFSLVLSFEVYQFNKSLDDVSYQPRLKRLLTASNDSTTFDLEQLPTDYQRELVEELCRLYPKGIKDTTTRVHRPCITKKDCSELFQHLSIQSSERVQEIITKIQAKNSELATWTLQKMYGRAKPAEAKINHWNKAKEINFYLNLDGKCKPEVWIKEF